MEFRRVVIAIRSYIFHSLCLLTELYTKATVFIVGFGPPPFNKNNTGKLISVKNLSSRHHERKKFHTLVEMCGSSVFAHHLFTLKNHPRSRLLPHALVQATVSRQDYKTTTTQIGQSRLFWQICDGAVYEQLTHKL